MPKGTKALKELANRDGLIISKAGKGWATIIQDIDSYIQEATWQLEDTYFYKKLTRNPTLEYNMKGRKIKDENI